VCTYRSSRKCEKAKSTNTQKIQEKKKEYVVFFVCLFVCLVLYVELKLHTFVSMMIALCPHSSCFIDDAVWRVCVRFFFFFRIFLHVSVVQKKKNGRKKTNSVKNEEEEEEDSDNGTFSFR
jgi:hypothetical protein